MKYLILALLTLSFAQAKEVLTIFSSRHYPVDAEVYELFEKETGIKIQHTHIKEAGQMIERLKLEGDRSQADIVITVDVGNLWRATQADLFQPFQSKLIEEAIPQSLREKNNLWTALTVRARVLAVQKDRVALSELNQYEDLALPKWKGKILVRSSNHVYNQSLVASLIANDGEDTATKWVQAVSMNLARKPQGGDRDQIRAIAEGIGDVAIVNSYYAGQMWESTNPKDLEVMKQIRLIFPNQNNRGAHINISGAGIFKYSKKTKLAQQFLEFLISKKVQTMYVQANAEFPARQEMEIDGVMASYQKIKFDKKSIDEIGSFTPAAIKMMDKSGWR
jgi:iron(III) transport system substrate-binding protein